MLNISKNNTLSFILVFLFISLPLKAHSIQGPGTAFLGGTRPTINPAQLEALRTIASRKGLMRLDYSNGKWSVFTSTYLTAFIRRITFKDRFDIIDPLEDLQKDVQKGALGSVFKDTNSFHLISQAYTSLSALYAYYKINPTKSRKHPIFIARFAEVLKGFKETLLMIENHRAVKARDLYLPLWQDGNEGIQDRELSLHYLEAPTEEMNAAMRSIGNTNTSIKRALLFIPTEKKNFLKTDINQTDVKPVVIFVLHGTFAKGSAEYSSDENMMFRQTRYMAQTVANHLQAPVEVYSFEWSGVNSNEDRMVAGEELANLVKAYFPSSEYRDFYVGHSHGGNVIYHAARSMREYRTPYTIVTLATPIREDFIVDNVNYLFHFYNTSDMVQYFGSYELTTRSSDSYISSQSPRTVTKEDMERLGLFKNNDRQDKVNVYNIRVKLNGQNPSGQIQSHSDMKYLVGVLPKILDDIVQSYEPNRHLMLNFSDLDLREGKNISVGHIEQLAFHLGAFPDQNLKEEEQKFSEKACQKFEKAYPGRNLLG